MTSILYTANFKIANISEVLSIYSDEDVFSTFFFSFSSSIAAIDGLNVNPPFPKLKREKQKKEMYKCEGGIGNVKREKKEEEKAKEFSLYFTLSISAAGQLENTYIRLTFFPKKHTRTEKI